MALGFGFNKAKVLGAAEKFVQQGRLQNAITEYLKVVNEDPKDLTVMNTIGDLYARVGQNEQASEYFKRVGEAYARDGFTVKAIAIYKKLTKLNPSATDCVVKLAELYSQQGLYNDARAQYLTIADRHLRSGNNEEATRIFRKMLELDPENAAMQAKLADLYVKLGNKEEARNIFFGAAELLFHRGAMEAAEEALGRVLNLDPTYSAALVLRGQIAAEAGKAELAVQCLEKVSNLDSQPDALRALLRGHLQLGNSAEAMPIATKLQSVHNDLSGITMCADWLVSAGEGEAALRLYEQYADRLLAADHDGMLEKMSSAVARVNRNAPALELVLKLYRKAGDTAHITEVMELLAHALVQAGELSRARDLYNELATLEPANPLHAQNYKQVSAKLGDDAVTRPLTPAEGAQALMVDELEIDAPAVKQGYSDELAQAIRAALTDSELLDSYNLPSKAIAPLEAVLPNAPKDVLINQRLASLYVRAERHSDAARCCDVLHSVYQKAGHQDLASQYAEMSAKYHERAGEPVPHHEEEAAEPAPPASFPEAAATPSVDVAALASLELEPAPVAEPESETASARPAKEEIHTGKLDVSRQWDEMVAVEPPARPAKPSPDSGSDFVLSQPTPAARAGDVVGDLLEEIRFYISQSMWPEAEAAIDKCAELAPDLPELEELRQQSRKSSTEAASIPEVEVIEDDSAADSNVATLVFDTSALGIPEDKPRPDTPSVSPRIPEPAATPVRKPAPVELPRVAAPPPARPAQAPQIAARGADALADMVLDLEQSLGSDFPARPPAEARPAAPSFAAQSAPVAAATAIPPHLAPAREVTVPVMSSAAATMVAPPQPPTPLVQPASALSDLFAEFKEDLEAEDAEPENDLETHYNLGVAFKEMGLLEEAIGELQKVCHAVDHGLPFPHTLQVYTWLAECLNSKGAPQAAIKWYQRALKLPGLDEETRMAVCYEMAAAFEAAGNRQAALDNFMEVYANNIDYRDVAQRIKTLKA